jgi:hypothetical protein
MTRTANAHIMYVAIGGGSEPRQPVLKINRMGGRLEGD